MEMQSRFLKSCNVRSIDNFTFSRSYIYIYKLNGVQTFEPLQLNSMYTIRRILCRAKIITRENSYKFHGSTRNLGDID